MMEDKVQKFLAEKYSALDSDCLTRSEQTINKIPSKVIARSKSKLLKKLTGLRGKKGEGLLDPIQEKKEKRLEKLQHLAKLDKKKKEEAENIMHEMEKFELERKRRAKLLKISKSQKNLSTVQENRKKEFKKSNKALKEVFKTTPLYEQISNRFYETFELPEIQKNKQILAQKKKFMAPISFEEIFTHSKKYRTEIEAKKLKRLQEIKNHRLTLAAHEASLGFYKPKVKTILETEEKQEKERVRSENLLKKSLVNKRKMYGNIVKEQFKPQISTAKRQEMKKSLEMYSSSKTRKDNFPSLTESRHSDYLKERRFVRNQVKHSNVYSLDRLDCRDIVEDMASPVHDRLLLLQERTRKHELKAKNFELLFGDDEAGYNALGSNETIANAYLDSIHAKLAFLNILN